MQSHNKLNKCTLCQIYHDFFTTSNPLITKNTECRVNSAIWNGQREKNGKILNYSLHRHTVWASLINLSKSPRKKNVFHCATRSLFSLLLVSLSFNFFLCQLGRLFVEFNLNVLGEFQTFSWHFPRLSLVRSWGWEEEKDQRRKNYSKQRQTTNNMSSIKNHLKEFYFVSWLAKLFAFSLRRLHLPLFCPARRRRHQQMTKFHFYERQSTWNCVRNDRKKRSKSSKTLSCRARHFRIFQSTFFPLSSFRGNIICE